MKSTFVMIIVALITVMPVVFVGIKHTDRKVAENLYEKGLVYDQSRSMRDNATISIETPECADSKCEMGLLVSPGPDDNTLSVAVHRPVGDSIILTGFTYSEGKWHISFPRHIPGWYAVKVEYKYNSIPVESEMSFYLN